MIIYPAVDLRGGKVVRLREGDPAQQTVFSDDPTSTALQWIEQGAQWIHMVNLDGAFAEANDNVLILQRVAKFSAKIQFGGGLRTIDDLRRAIDAGASRVVIGTAAIQKPELIAEAVMRWGADVVCVALDARDDRIATHGWQQLSDLTPVALGNEMVSLGVQHALYTDVSRDGMLSGVNVEATAALARETGLHVIASGGVSTLDDIRALTGTDVAGAVVGMALYEGRFTLRAALDAAEGK